jgi:hypothetical protein
MTNDKMQGEGNYDAAREYDEQATSFARDKAKVSKAAQAAKQALDSPEAIDLAAAERAGKRRSRP